MHNLYNHHNHYYQPLQPSPCTTIQPCLSSLSICAFWYYVHVASTHHMSVTSHTPVKYFVCMQSFMTLHTSVCMCCIPELRPPTSVIAFVRFTWRSSQPIPLIKLCSSGLKQRRSGPRQRIFIGLPEHNTSAGYHVQHKATKEPETTCQTCMDAHMLTFLRNATQFPKGLVRRIKHFTGPPEGGGGGLGQP